MPVVFDSILVGTDGSATAAQALAKAADLAERVGARLHVVSAYEPAAARVGGRQPVPEAGEWTLGPDFKVDAVLERAESSIRRDGLEVELHARRGDPADGILALAKETNADLIVLGSKGMHGARRLLGSVPNKVSHGAPCDVLIVHTE
jgi:nucleotide-binding universal stress UspA family protein